MKQDETLRIIDQEISKLKADLSRTRKARKSMRKRQPEYIVVAWWGDYMEIDEIPNLVSNLLEDINSELKESLGNLTFSLNSMTHSLKVDFKNNLADLKEFLSNLQYNLKDILSDCSSDEQLKYY